MLWPGEIVSNRKVVPDVHNHIVEIFKDNLSVFIIPKVSATL